MEAKVSLEGYANMLGMAQRSSDKPGDAQFLGDSELNRLNGEYRVLLVDDDLQVLDVLSEMLRLEGYQVVTAENGREALDRIARQRFDLVVTDLIMPEQEGLETISQLRQHYPDVPILAISGGGRLGPMDYLETARFIGADATLAKPFGRQEFIVTVNGLIAASD